MNLFITFLIVYFSGVIAAAFVIRHINAKEIYKEACVPPPVCLLSWLATLLLGVFAISDSIQSKDGLIAKFFNYTDKE